MNARVALLHAQPGQAVGAQEPLIVLESMKMEHTLYAPCEGELHAPHAAEGEQVATGKVLAEVRVATRQAVMG